MESIVVTGIGLCLPGCAERSVLWQQLSEGESQLRSRPDPSCPLATLAMGAIDDAQIERQLSEISPAFVAKYHRETKLYLASLFGARKDAGLIGEKLDSSRIGLFDGTSRGSFGFWLERLARGGAYDSRDLMFGTPGQSVNLGASLLGIRGPSYTYTQSCAAGAVAIGHGYRELQTGQLDVAYVTGHDAPLLAPIFETYKSTGLLAAAKGDAKTALRPYIDSAGNVFGEGAVTLVLETLDHAVARGATILASLAGFAYGNNGGHPSHIESTGRRPAEVILAALANEDLDLEEVEYVVGHGNGVPGSDQSELRYMERLFGDRLSEVPLLSVKPIYGHALGASSALSVAAAVLIAHHGRLVPTINVEPGPDHRFRHREDQGKQRPCDIGVCVSYGIGGHNSAVAIRSASATLRDAASVEESWTRPSVRVQSPAARLQSIASAISSGRGRMMSLHEAIDFFVVPGQHLHFASTPSRSNAAVLELAKKFKGTKPDFTLSATGFHSSAHLLAGLRLGARYRSCFYGDNYPTPRPNPLYQQLEEEGAILEHWSLATYVEALRAGALGHPAAFTRSLVGTDLGRDLAARGLFDEDTARGCGMVTAWAPDITFIHASAATPSGDVVACAPSCEGFWSAHSARVGTIVTVERELAPDELAGLRDSIVIPGQRVLAVCVVPGGALPQPHFALPRFGVRGYADNFAQYEHWRVLAKQPEELERFVARVLEADDVHAAYRDYAADMLATHGQRAKPRANWKKKVPELVHGLDSSERMAIAGGRALADRIEDEGLETILAGIGHSFNAARLAVALLRHEGRRFLSHGPVMAMVETGLLDIAVGDESSAFLLSHGHINEARRLSTVEDVLGCLTGGPNNRTIGVFGAAQIDASGNVNSLRSDSGRLIVGSGGANDIAATAREVLVTLPWSRLVAKVAHITSTGRGVRTLVTDKGTLARGEDGAWTLTDIWATGQDIQAQALELVASAPWTISIAENLQVLAAPTRFELDRLAGFGNPKEGTLPPAQVSEQRTQPSHASDIGHGNWQLSAAIEAEQRDAAAARQAHQ